MNESRSYVLPEPGAKLPCLICTREGSWGIFDPATGAAICATCRDAARIMPSLVQHRLFYGMTNIFRRTWSVNCSCGWDAVHDTHEQSQVAAFEHMIPTLNALNDFGAGHYREETELKGKST